MIQFRRMVKAVISWFRLIQGLQHEVGAGDLRAGELQKQIKSLDLFYNARCTSLSQEIEQLRKIISAHEDEKKSALRPGNWRSFQRDMQDEAANVAIGG